MMMMMMISHFLRILRPRRKKRTILDYLLALLPHRIKAHLLQHHLLRPLDPNLRLHKPLQMQLHHLRLLELPERLLNAILHHRSNKRLKRHNLVPANPGISLPQSLHCTLCKSVLCNSEQTMHSLQSTKSPKATEQLPDLHFGRSIALVLLLKS